MSPTHPFRPGARLGRFRLERLLGQGAHAVVWLATDEGGFGFRRKVALKILCGRTEVRRQEALLREARICGALNHPGLVAVSGVGRDGDCPYMVMEYVQGETLSSLWKDLRAVGVRFPRSVILEIGISVADALHHAWTATDPSGHPLRLVHRDLKPANILLSDRGGAKVADFGIAETAAGPGPGPAQGDRLKGTPAYMSPELWMGTRDFRPGIDLWSLGVVLWELAAGRRFFGEAKMAELPELIRRRDPQAEAAEVEGYFPILAPLLARLLSRRIDERPATGLELASELRRARSGVRITGDLVQFMRVVRAGRLAPADRDGSLNVLPSMPYVADDWLPLLGLAEVEPDEVTGERGRLDQLQDFRPLRVSLTQARGLAGRDVEAPTVFDIPPVGVSPVGSGDAAEDLPSQAELLALDPAPPRDRELPGPASSLSLPPHPLSARAPFAGFPEFAGVEESDPPPSSPASPSLAAGEEIAAGRAGPAGVESVDSSDAALDGSWMVRRGRAGRGRGVWLGLTTLFLILAAASFLAAGVLA